MCEIKQKTLTILSWLEMALSITLTVSCLMWMLQKEIYENDKVTDGWISATHIRPWVWYEEKVLTLKFFVISHKLQKRLKKLGSQLKIQKLFFTVVPQYYLSHTINLNFKNSLRTEVISNIL